MGKVSRDFDMVQQDGPPKTVLICQGVLVQKKSSGHFIANDIDFWETSKKLTENIFGLVSCGGL